MKVKWAQLRHDAGGKWLAYFPPFLLLLPVWLVSSILLLVDTGSAQELGAASVANVVALGCAAGELGILRHFRTRCSSHVTFPLWLVLVSGAVLGGTKTVVMSWVYWLFFPHLSLSEELVQRLPSTLILGMWLLPTLAIVFAVLERYQREKQALLTTLVRESRRSDPASSSLSAQYVSVLSELITRTRTRLTRAENNPAEITALLTELASSDVRNLSHTMWKDHHQRFANFTLRDLVRSALSSHNYPTVAIVLAYVLYTAPAQFFYVGAGEALLRLALQAVIITVVVSIAKRIPTTGYLTGLLVFIATSISIPVLIEVTTVNLFGPLGSVNIVVVAVVLMITLATTTLIFSIITLVVRSHKEIVSELSQMLTPQELDVIHRGSSLLADRDLANYLHGYVQSRILASVMRISSSTADDLTMTVARERRTIEELLSEVETYNTADPVSFDAEAQALTQEWSRLAEITWEVASVVSNDDNPHHIRRRIDACREAVTNAVRHGLASHITITLTPTILVVKDNGTGPRNGSAGLGSALFESFSDSGSWSLTPGESAGSVLQVSLVCD